MSEMEKDKIIPSAIEATEEVVTTSKIKEQQEIIENEFQKSGNEIQEENERD